MQEVIIQLEGLSKVQCSIADFLWHADSEEDMQFIYEAFGRYEVEVVKQMMLAASLNDIEDVSQASEILQSFTL